MQQYKKTRILEYKHTRLQGYKDTGIQEYKNAKIQEYEEDHHTILQKIRAQEYNNTRVHKIQGLKKTNTQ